MLLGEIAVQVSCHGVTSSEASVFQTWLDRAAGNAVRCSSALEGKRSRGQRVLGAPLGARGSRTPAASVTESFEVSV